MKLLIFICLFVFASLSTPLSAQLQGKELQTSAAPVPFHVDSKDLDEYLPGVIQRGQLIYEYDQAAWHGTDAFFELNNDVLEFKIQADAKIEGSYHTHVLSDVPEDTDVFYVLNRNPRREEFIRIPSDKSRTFLIQTDGHIILVDSKPH